MSNRSFFHSAPVLWISLHSHLRHSAHHSTSSSSTSCSCRLSLISQLNCCLSQINKISFAFLFHLNLYSPGLLSAGYLWFWPCLAFSSHFYFVSAHHHIIHQCNFLFVFSLLLHNNLRLSCSSIMSTVNQLQCILLFIVTSFYTISFF